MAIVGMTVDCKTRDDAWCLCLDGHIDEYDFVTAQTACSKMKSCRRRLRGLGKASGYPARSEKGCFVTVAKLGSV